MDKMFVRNFFIFIVIMTVFAGALCYGLIKGERTMGQSDSLVNKTHGVITEAERLAALVEGMLADQRGYLLSGQKSFLESYEEKKANVSDHIASLSELTSEDKSQQSRLDELRGYFSEFSTKLEERARAQGPAVAEGQELANVELLDNVKNNIMRLNSSFLNEEYELLTTRINQVEDKKGQYFRALLIGVVFSTIILLIFNGFLLHAQRKRTRVEESLKDSEERFILAVEGTQDGIFDWDIAKNQIFCSRRFYEMLGYNKDASLSAIEDVLEYIHPDDKDRVWQSIQSYIAGKLSEYSQDFRMKHATGRWIWVQSRAKALFDKSGQATRMVGAHTDITHLKKEAEKLEAEKNQAIDANRAKSEFLAHMSHEIRTPLNAISGIAEIFEKNMDNMDDRQQRLVGVLSSSTSSLKDLIDDILDFSKIENGDLELENDFFPLGQLFEEVVSMMNLRASEKGISFVFDHKETRDFEFYGDSKRIRQILVNLVTNAIKFTNEGGVTVRTCFEERDGIDFLRIDVSDTGIGIEPENFDLVFERFKQADSSVSRKYGGSGLGLPISRNLASFMGGDIFMSSELGKGSTFSVLLPVKKTKENAGKKKDMGDSEKLNDQIRTSLHGENKILIVEDYEGNVVVLTYMMEELGIKYDIARTGVEAVNLWKDNHYDIILMDIQMPEMDGFTATKEIRRSERQNKYAYTPIIGMTAHALVGDKDKCIEVGMDAYLPKPIVKNNLKKEILRFLKEHKKAA